MAEKDATEKNGASEEQESKHQERRDAVERVLEGRHKDLEGDGIQIDPGEELVPPEEEEQQAGEAGPEGEPPTKEPDPPDPDEEMVTIKVRGEEKQVRKSEALDAGIRVLQKETDLEKRYDEVTKMQKELERRLDGLPPKKEETPPTDTEVDDEVDVSQLAHDLQYGTAEEAEAAIRKLKRSGGDSLSEDQIREAVLNIRKEEKTGEVVQMMKQPQDKGGYADLMEDPVLQRRFAAEVDILVEHEGMAYDSFETYKKAGDLVRKTYVSATTKVEVPLTKQERKEATDTVTGANIIDKSEQPETETTPKSGDEIASDVILDMKKKRGQV